MKNLITIKAIIVFMCSIATLHAQDVTVATAKAKTPWSAIENQEIKDLRYRNAKMFDMGKGTQKAYVSIGSLHYFENGIWSDIDLTINAETNSNFVFSNTTNAFKTFYPNEFTATKHLTTRLAQYNVEERVISVDFEDDGKEKIQSITSSFANAHATNNSVVYNTSNSGLTVKYSQQADARKMDVMLAHKSIIENAPANAAFIAITEELIIPTNWVVKESRDEIDLYDGATWMVNIPKPVATESFNKKKEYASDEDLMQAGTYSYVLDGNKLVLVSRFDIAWLRSANRSFPVSLDPTLTFFPQNVTRATGYMTSATGAPASGFLRVAGVNNNAYARFELTGLASISALTVTGARFWGNHYTTVGADQVTTIRGFDNIDPIIATGPDVFAKTTTGTLYSNSYVFGTTAFGWRMGALNPPAFNDIVTAIPQGWFAIGFDWFSGSTTFMYQYGYNAAASTDRPYLEVDYIVGTPTSIPPIASMAYTKIPLDTVWVGSPRTMVNTSTGADKSYWDILGFNAVTKNGPYAAFPETRTPKNSDGIFDNFIDTINNAVNFKYTFPNRGFYRVKVTALNKFGKDTYIDTIYVDTPATKPKADFFADKRIVGVYDFASMFDLTTNGPVSWFWYLRPGYYNPLSPFFNSFSPSAGAQNPILNANEGGLFDVCLVATNYRGTDTMCKPGYMKIISGYEVCKGTSTAKDTIARENEGSAKLYTVGGKYVPNLIGTCSKGFTIATCSDTATLYIDRFRMRVGTPSDSLLIRLGNASGPVLARMGGTILPAAFSTIKVPGGIAYLQTIINNPASATPPGDSGYVVRWSAPPASYSKPTAAFNMPDTVYDGYTVQYVNTTAGKNISYAWDTNGDNVYGVDNPSSSVDSISTNPTRTFAVFAAYTAKICLKAYNCVGSDTFCKTIQFLPVSATPSADFIVNRSSGFTTDTFRFTDKSQNGPNQWLWTFVPNNVAYLNGTNATSQNPVLLLNSATNYDVTLRATNQQGSNTITKFGYASAIAFGNPGCSGCPVSGGQPYMPGSLDVGINRVTLADLDTTTALNTPIYHALYNVKIANVYRGVTYTLSTARTTANDPMSTRAWIDFNRNTNFGDVSNETIISENNQTKAVTTGTFTVPANAPIGNTRMRVGVTYGSTSITDKVTTLGVFEEYGINIAIDAIKPTIALKGSSLEKVEVNKPYIEKGVVGIDNLEGDISSRYQVFGTVNVNKVGYYTLKYIVADLYGNNSDTVTRTVQVEINQTGPSLTLLGSDSIAIEVFNSYVELGATALSNTGSNLTSQIIRTGIVDTTALGTYFMSYSITDQFGFNTTKTRKVVVMDTTKPNIVTNAGTSTINHQVGTPYMDPVTVKDNYWKGIVPTRTGVINPGIPGSYSLIYNGVDGSGNIAPTYFVTVVVKDLVPPTITLVGQDPLIVDVHTTFNDPGVETSDNYYPNVTTVRTGLPSMNILGDYLVTYTATDGAGNTSTVTRLVKVVDRIVPEIQLLGNNPFEHVRFKAYVEPGVKIKDNYYADSTLQGLLVIDQSKLDVSMSGIYFVTYNVTDPSGNKAKRVQRLVTVVEVTGINELTNNANLSIYPNPSKGLFTVSNKTQTAITSVKVMDVVGKVVYTQATQSNEVAVDLTSATKGLYFVVIKDETGKEYSSKIVVE